MAVSKRLRFEILRRDNHQCRYCGGAAPDVPLRVDHVVPVALGGSNDPSNLVTACEPCNSGKSSVPADAATVANVADDALRWAAAMRQAADEISAEEDSLEAICVAVQNRWHPRWMPSDYRNSIYAFVKAGLTEADLIALVDVALSARGVDDRFGRAGALADRRADAMRYHPSVRPLDDFDQHADDAVNLVTADHQERADFACWERELRGVR